MNLDRLSGQSRGKRHNVGLDSFTALRRECEGRQRYGLAEMLAESAVVVRARRAARRLARLTVLPMVGGIVMMAAAAGLAMVRRLMRYLASRAVRVIMGMSRCADEPIDHLQHDYCSSEQWSKLCEVAGHDGGG